jgi:hypothetical protein
MRVGDMVVIKRTAHSAGSKWFKDTRDSGTHMRVTNIDEDESISPIFWRVTLAHPECGVVYVSVDHLEGAV